MNGTATAGSDYVTTGGTLTFTAGQTSKTFVVNGIEDLTDESDENYTITLSNPTNASLTDASGLGTVVDDDGTPSLQVADTSATE